MEEDDDGEDLDLAQAQGGNTVAVVNKTVSLKPVKENVVSSEVSSSATSSSTLGSVSSFASNELQSGLRPVIAPG